MLAVPEYFSLTPGEERALERCRDDDVTRRGLLDMLADKRGVITVGLDGCVRYCGPCRRVKPDRCNHCSACARYTTTKCEKRPLPITKSAYSEIVTVTDISREATLSLSALTRNLHTCWSAQTKTGHEEYI
ncbi:hypothetical protein HPB48_011950 [Haemaphysalis longicornis]|uniref:Uncharacterized protein n=1 Tax=Haemaphysalis longicornis TaxID=44386 RepID=A0A9J6FW79_HAELO|nr:hypothetical protein HPB48_011950 [Haemaphysalis longicornis]